MILLLVAGLAAGASALAQSRYQHPSYDGFFAQENRQRQNDNRREMDNRRFNNDRDAYRQPRRGERLSPDERRMLRQQIDEAGRDIYAPRRR